MFLFLTHFQFAAFEGHPGAAGRVLITFLVLHRGALWKAAQES